MKKLSLILAGALTVGLLGGCGMHSSQAQIRSSAHM